MKIIVNLSGNISNQNASLLITTISEKVKEIKDVPKTATLVLDIKIEN